MAQPIRPLYPVNDPYSVYQRERELSRQRNASKLEEAKREMSAILEKLNDKNESEKRRRHFPVPRRKKRPDNDNTFGKQ